MATHGILGLSGAHGMNGIFRLRFHMFSFILHPVGIISSISSFRYQLVSDTWEKEVCNLVVDVS